jgi:hypothetical protein
MANKVVVNLKYGGYQITEEMEEWFLERNFTKEEISNLERHDPMLVKCVEECVDARSVIGIVEIEGNTYCIDEYDGMEIVVEPQDFHWIVIK